MAKSKKINTKYPPLQILKQKLHTEGYASEYVAGADSDGFDHLFIPLDEFEEGEEDVEVHYVLQAFFVEDMLIAETPDLKPEEIPQFATLQLISEMPVSWEGVAQERFADGMALLNVFSQKLPFGQLHLDGDMIVYTYAYPSETQKLPVSVIASMLDMISFFINRMGPVLETFVSSNMNWEQGLNALDTLMSE